ncbi:MAG: TonB-dependent receptor [Asticcacaulis sp.]|uniref:TonB-dependent receptor plug domain-containing protein n=1 Tax=Asticcacaulis sp. TaxID=1872648 RepID=UPI0039E47799
MRNRKTALILSTALLALPVFAHADETPQEIIVTVTREALPVSKVGQSVDVLTDADIKSYQSLFVADLLTRTTDLSIARNGGPGSTTTASIRGAGADHTLYMLDGVRLNDPSQVGGGTNLGLVSTDDASRIEVLRGPLSTLWGSGAMGGVVSITSRTPTEKLEGDLRVEGFDQYGSARAGIGGKVDRLTWRLSGSTYNDRGVSTYAGGSEKDGFTQTTLNGKLRYDFNESLSLQAFSTTSHSRDDFDGYPAPDYVFADTGEFGKNDTSLSVVGLTHRFAKGEQVLSVSVTDNDNTYYNDDHTPNYDANGHIEAADYHVSYRLDAATRLLGGLSYERDTMRIAYPSSYDPDPVPTRASSTLASLYGQVTHDFGPLDVALSARHDDASSFGGNDIAQVTVNAPLGDHFRLHASAGQGVKVPSLYQLYSDYGTSGLTEEKSTTLDGGVDYDFTGGVFSVSLFTRSVRDQIDFVYSGCRDDQVYGCYGNIDRTETRGVELELSKDLTDALHLRGNYTFLHARDDAGSLLPRRPDQMGSLDLTWNATAKLDLGFGLRHVGEALDTAYTGMLKAYDLVDLRADYALNDRLSIYGRIENAGDTRYQTAGGYGQTGRRVWLGIHARLF